jgi:hypothetical protein
VTPLKNSTTYHCTTSFPEPSYVVILRFVGLVSSQRGRVVGRRIAASFWQSTNVLPATTEVIAMSKTTGVAPETGIVTTPVCTPFALSTAALALRLHPTAIAKISKPCKVRKVFI